MSQNLHVQTPTREFIYLEGVWYQKGWPGSTVEWYQTIRPEGLALRRLFGKPLSDSVLADFYLQVLNGRVLKD